MRTLLLSVAAVAVLVGAAHAEPRQLSGFTRVSASAGTQVEITVGQAFSVDVSGPDAARIITRVSGDTLIVEPERGNWRGRRNATVRVTMPAVQELDASSGARINATGVNSPNIALEVSSGAHLNVAGACGAFVADASSGADLNASGLRCETGSVDASSGARARVHATGRLNVDASSGGDVIAYGNPGIGDIDLSSGGSLRRAS